MSKGNSPIYIRADDEFRARMKRHASKPQFGGVESTFGRYSIGVVMDLQEALGPRFELEVARLLDPREKSLESQVAA